MTSALVFDGRPLSIEDVTAIARRERGVALGDSAFRARIDAGAGVVANLLARDGAIYGVTTGFGDSVTVPVPVEFAGELSHALFRYHGVGLGAPFEADETRAVLVARTQSLALGWSGIRSVVLERLVWLLTHDVLPVIPSEGSVGASGDLTPLSYVAAVLCGERDVRFEGARVSAASVFAKLGLAPLTLGPKEGLALMNGTSVMTGLACLAFERAVQVVDVATKATAMTSAALLGNPGHFDERLFSAKPHTGPQRVAARVRALLGTDQVPLAQQRLQDRYSVRCAPHVIGAAEDAFPWLRSLIENELNSANDNPLIDVEQERVLHGGHFYGGHIALAMDTLKNVVANLADLMDRQLALLVDPRFNHGLPANLSGATGPRAALNHGLKALQIAASAWTAEALKLTMPASVFSRSTECHNQDKVSMGTIAARDAMRVCQLTEQVGAALSFACAQAVELRRRAGVSLPPGVQRVAGEVGVRFVEEDRALDAELPLPRRDAR